MSQFKRELTVAWGDCDHAGIVFYPTFFYWFDTSYHHFLASRGTNLHDLRERYQAVTPLVDVGATFRSPVTYGDVIQIETEVAEWGERRLRLNYTVKHGERLVATGFEQRAWALYVEGGGMRGGAVPEEFKQLLS